MIPNEMAHCKQRHEKKQKKEVPVMVTQAEVQTAQVEKLRIPQFADYIGTTIPNARGLIHRREVDFFKIGKLILVPKSEAKRILRDGFRPRQDGENTGE